jgi:hypothetical protein
MMSDFMTNGALSLSNIIDIKGLGFDAGAHVLIKEALCSLAVGQVLDVIGINTGGEVSLVAWCRTQGHSMQWDTNQQRALITKGEVFVGRWQGAERTGHSDSSTLHAIQDQAQPSWGLAARGATVEAGAPQWSFRLNQKAKVWANNAAQLYAQAVAAQWNPDEVIDWSQPCELPAAVEAAVVQVMTYMVENENAALIVPAKFLGQLHPHFREIQALLAIQVADEARHIEVFTRRIRLKGYEPALSTVGGQASLKTLVDEPDFSLAAFLLSVLGEGTFVNLLNFLQECAPDPITRQIARLAAIDESRHVAFGMAHLTHHLSVEPALRGRLALAVESRFDHLSGTSGLNEEVFDALILLAAGDITPKAIQQGYQRVQGLMQAMAEGRKARLLRLGFTPSEATRLSSLHTRNFM